MRSATITRPAMRKVKGLMAMATAANSNATKARGLTRRALAAHTKGKGSGSAAASVSGTRHGSAGSTSGHGKPKKVIVWRCLCCKASSEDTPWPGKTSNAPVAACKRCWETYQVGHFHMFGTFEDIAKKLDHDAEAKLKQDWQSALGRPDSGAKDFLEETVEGIDGFELYMEQSYLGISRQQFREVTGKTPEECKMKVMDLPLVTTEGLEKGPKMYKGFLVKDPQMPYTRYILRRRIGVDKRKTFMGPEQHLYPRQARLLQNFQATLGFETPELKSKPFENGRSPWASFVLTGAGRGGKGEGRKSQTLRPLPMPQALYSNRFPRCAFLV